MMIPRSVIDNLLARITLRRELPKLRPVMPPEASEEGRELAYVTSIQCLRGVASENDARNAIELLAMHRDSARLELRAAENALLGCAPEIRGKINGYDEVILLLTQAIEAHKRNLAAARAARNGLANRAVFAAGIAMASEEL